MFKPFLALPAPCNSETCINIKIELNFIFTLLHGALKGFVKADKAFIKPFEARQKSVEVKI